MNVRSWRLRTSAGLVLGRVTIQHASEGPSGSATLRGVLLEHEIPAEMQSRFDDYLSMVNENALAVADAIQKRLDMQYGFFLDRVDGVERIPVRHVWVDSSDGDFDLLVDREYLTTVLDVP